MLNLRCLSGYGLWLLLLYATAGGLVAQENLIIELPPPDIDGKKSLAQLLQQRRSVREYSREALSLSDLGQLLWAAQGITHTRGLRTAPSAGALYPLELYVAVGKVNGLEPGVYRYQIQQHRLEQQVVGDKRIGLGRAALWQTWMAKAPVIFVFAAEYERTGKKYGLRAKRYVHMEVGHAAQNLFLQVEDLGLATVVVGAFDDAVVADILALPPEIEPLTLMPVGRKRK
ncbi:MAG: SagB/ThcOx family dehydrogenase [Halobacteria archaeon]|nr:SagB/ThcOx family dehydrogenase [Halobacteria archaeon]